MSRPTASTSTTPTGSIGSGTRPENGPPSNGSNSTTSAEPTPPDSYTKESTSKPPKPNLPTDPRLTLAVYAQATTELDRAAVNALGFLPRQRRDPGRGLV